MPTPRSKSPGPSFVRYIGPMLDVLRELGGSARPAEVHDALAKRLQISEQEQTEQMKSGASRFSNQVYWARFYLAKAGMIHPSTRGVWSLTDVGRSTQLSHDDALALFKRVAKQWGKQRGSGSETETVPPSGNGGAIEDGSPADERDHRAELLAVLKDVPPKGFERLCQRLLREAGFEQVEVTGQSGDGGIDGHGLLQVNPLVSFRTYFQCKRYKKSVGPEIVRDFRGAMAGRADKGIIITTATFTSSARAEAERDGAQPIELVDGEKLIDLFEQLELGLVPRKAFDIDHGFFAEFQKA